MCRTKLGAKVLRAVGPDHIPQKIAVIWHEGEISYQGLLLMVIATKVFF